MESDILQTKATHTASSRTRHLSLKEKNAIIAFSENGNSIAQTASKFRISGTAVNYILKKKDAYKAGAERRQLKGRTRIDSGQHQLLEEILLQWIKQKRDLGIAITGPIIQEKALAIDKELWLRAKENIADANLQPSTFKASQGWLDKFKKRNGIRQISFKGEKLSADKEAATQFPQEFVQFVNDGKYDLDNVYNADELGLIAKSLPAKTLAIGEEKEAPGFKLQKERVTVMACANATGTHKIPLLLIGKSKQPRCFPKDVTKLPLIYTNQKNAWMDGQVFKHWYEHVFIPAVKEKKPGPEENFLLLVDNAPSHPSANILNTIDTQFKIMFLPPNVTPLIQPMDQGVIESLKRHFKKNFLRQLIFEDTKSFAGVADFLKKWSLLDTVHALTNAWSCVTQRTICKAWTNLMGQEPLTDSAIVQSGELVHMMAEIDSENSYETADIEEWIREDSLEPTCKNLNDQEIIAKVMGELSEDTECNDKMGPEFDDENSMENPHENTIDAMRKQRDDLIQFRKSFETSALCTKKDIDNFAEIQERLDTTLYNALFDKKNSINQ